MNNRILIIDDEPDIAQFMGEVAQHMGFEVKITCDPGVFRKAVADFKPSVILLDLQMPEQDGIEILRWLAGERSDAAIMITSGMDTRVLTTAEQLGKSLGLKVVQCLAKPVSIDQLEVALAQLKANERHLTADDLGKAIEAGQLVVHYQPQAVLKGPGRWIIESAEALVRWRHEEFGLIYPQDFLQLAEDNDLIKELTDFVFRSAMEQARVWFANGLYMEVSLNLSAQFLTDLEFPDRLLTLVRENNLDPAMITLELTEIAAMTEPEVAMDILARLRVKQVNLCIDDFGTGFSSLTQLYRMPFSELKIDNSFIADMQTSEDAEAMVEGLIYLAHKLKLKACAEGVESERALTMLENMHCDRVQGHLIGQAMAPKELERVVEDWNSRYRPQRPDRVA